MSLEVDLNANLNVEANVDIEIEVEAEVDLQTPEDVVEGNAQVEIEVEAPEVQVDIQPVEIEVVGEVDNKPQEIEAEAGGSGSITVHSSGWHTSSSVCMIIWGVILLLCGLGTLGWGIHYAIYLQGMSYNLGYLIGVYFVMPCIFIIAAALLFWGARKAIHAYPHHYHPTYIRKVYRVQEPQAQISGNVEIQVNA